MRIANRLLAFLLSLALTLGAVLVLIEIVAYAVGAKAIVLDWPGLYRWASGTTWGSGIVRLVGVGLAVIGLLLLAAQLNPRRPDRLRLQAVDSATDAAITRRGLARTLRDAAIEVDGVHDAHVTVGRHLVRVRAEVHDGAAPSVDSLHAAVASAAQHRLDALRLAMAPALSVRIRQEEQQ
ncbi:alkaline shock response membrane anchor protein AmaP [Micromonospora yasonensis]|uniref:alkaline shock response membrane anchor protein AmaP n=1 Tax=Micromonospora yasonensis TaxID=1128667 RepID=UPI002230E92A|nr:alkaline shock response membrane anchor protein AmaP [Micromonospora yasonensis]MCW3844351.1 alkaline shock response membrane anchor protein AmaP [Micromonospora yasonensis]